MKEDKITELIECGPQSKISDQIEVSHLSPLACQWNQCSAMVKLDGGPQQQQEFLPALSQPTETVLKSKRARDKCSKW